MSGNPRKKSKEIFNPTVYKSCTEILEIHSAWASYSLHILYGLFRNPITGTDIYSYGENPPVELDLKALSPDQWLVTDTQTLECTNTV